MGRADLNVGLRCAQIGHALITWTLQYGAPPDNLVVLQVPNETALQALVSRLQGRVVEFREPDLDNALTAIAAGPEAKAALRRLPLLR